MRRIAARLWTHFVRFYHNIVNWFASRLDTAGELISWDLAAS
jgi:hypothetical protein